MVGINPGEKENNNFRHRKSLGFGLIVVWTFYYYFHVLHKARQLRHKSERKKIPKYPDAVVSYYPADPQNGI